MLLKLVVAAMENQNSSTLEMMVVADWLEEFGKGPELQHYLTLLRTESPKVNDWLSIIDKFGTGKERKQSQRVKRSAILCFAPRSSKRKKRVKKWFHKQKAQEKIDGRICHAVLNGLREAANKVE